MSNVEELRAWFSKPERYKEIGPKAIWLTEDNIAALAKNEYFMAHFRNNHPRTK